MASRLEDSAAGWEGFFKNRSVLGLFFISVGILCALVLFIGAISFAFGWIGAATNVVSPANVRAQFALAYDDYNALQKLNDTLCITQAGVQVEQDPFIKSQRRTQLLAYEAQYNRVAAEYQARYDDAFRAKHVGPGDLPKEIPPVSSILAACP